MYTHDLIVIGTGSTYPLIETLMNRSPEAKVAVIDKDDPGGICHTRGSVPSMMLLQYARLVRQMEIAGECLQTQPGPGFSPEPVMRRMRTGIERESRRYRRRLTEHPGVEFIQEEAVFTAPYTLSVGKRTISAPFMVLATGSAPAIPDIDGLEKTGYLTTDSLLSLKSFPKRLVIVGDGPAATEYGFFFAAVGVNVVIVGIGEHILPAEEPEVSALAQESLSRFLSIIPGSSVLRVSGTPDGEKRIDIRTGDGNRSIFSDAILVATGRAPVNLLLKPGNGGISITESGWIAVNEYLETSQKNIWAIGYGGGRYPYKHVADFETDIICRNAILGDQIRADYRIVPHAIRLMPEIASVGLGEDEAVLQYGEEHVRIGFWQYSDSSAGFATGVTRGFVKVILEITSGRILGAHISGPDATLLIQELITAMHAGPGGIRLILASMHVHPSYSEVVLEACLHTYTVPAYHRYFTGIQTREDIQNE